MSPLCLGELWGRLWQCGLRGHSSDRDIQVKGLVSSLGLNLKGQGCGILHVGGDGDGDECGRASRGHLQRGPCDFDIFYLYLGSSLTVSPRRDDPEARGQPSSNRGSSDDLQDDHITGAFKVQVRDAKHEDRGAD